jgi:hypothetical protein
MDGYCLKNPIAVFHRWGEFSTDFGQFSTNFHKAMMKIPQPGESDRLKKLDDPGCFPLGR